MQLVIFVSNQVVSDLLLSKLDLIFNNFELINIDDSINPIFLESKFKNKKVYFIDLVNNIKSKHLLSFIVSNNSLSCFDFKYLFRNNLHFKYSGRFFTLLELKSLRKVSFHEIKIYNRSSDHTLDLLNGLPVIFKPYNNEFEPKTAYTLDQFKDIYNQLISQKSEFLLTEFHDSFDFIEFVVKSNQIKFAYNQNQKITILPEEIKGNMLTLASKLPNQIMTIKMVKSNDNYVFDSFSFGINAKFLEFFEESEVYELLDNLPL